LYYAANTEWEAYDQWQVTQSHTILLERQPDGSLCLVSDQYHSQDDRLPCSVDCPSYKKYGVHIKGGGSIENLVDSYVKLWDLSFPLENQLPTIYWDLMEELPVVRSSNIYKDRQRFGQYYLEQNEEGDPILHKVKSVYQIESVEQVDDGYEVNVNIFTYMGYSYTENGCYTDVMGVGFPHVL
ncbi:MAG: hypothetical protein J6I64_02610, partial [Lachnospiraceae bacterium]|nr:hypothetical protein [Lachnospiraceae bacterium]